MCECIDELETVGRGLDARRRKLTNFQCEFLSCLRTEIIQLSGENLWPAHDGQFPACLCDFVYLFLTRNDRISLKGDKFLAIISNFFVH